MFLVRLAVFVLVGVGLFVAIRAIWMQSRPRTNAPARHDRFERARDEIVVEAAREPRNLPNPVDVVDDKVSTHLEELKRRRD
jgi:hypothetical protein